MSYSRSPLIPVFTQYGLVEMADAARVRQLRSAPNAECVRRHKDGQLMRINLRSHGDDHALRTHHANPQADVHAAETDNNPRGVWTFKRNCRSAAEPPQS